MKSLLFSILFLLSNVIAFSINRIEFRNDDSNEFIENTIKKRNRQDSLRYKYFNQRQKVDSIWLSKDMAKYGYDMWGLDNIDVKYISDSIFSSNQIQNMRVLNIPYFNNPQNQRKLYNMKYLHSLSFVMNWNFVIDRDITSAPLLDTLILTDNRIDTLQDWIFDIPNLKILFWRNNSIFHISNQRISPISLKEIVFCEPFIYELPVFLYRMRELNYLVIELGKDANYTGIDSIISANQNLIGLNIGRSNLKCIPMVVYDLKLLNTLIWAENCISNIPSSIEKLKSLQILVLSHNQLSSLPEEIKELKDNLEELDLRDNPIPVEEQERIKKWLPNTKIYFD